MTGQITQANHTYIHLPHDKMITDKPQVLLTLLYLRLFQNERMMKNENRIKAEAQYPARLNRSAPDERNNNTN